MTIGDNDKRDGEIVVDVPPATDAGLIFIGRIHTPWTKRSDAPRQGSVDGPLCRIELFDLWRPALLGVESLERLVALYWLHQSRRDLVVQSPAHSGSIFGAFSLRTPVRPNPIGLSTVLLERIDGCSLYVRGLDCLDGTPLLDLKPELTKGKATRDKPDR